MTSPEHLYYQLSDLEEHLEQSRDRIELGIEPDDPDQANAHGQIEGIGIALVALRPIVPELGRALRSRHGIRELDDF